MAEHRYLSTGMMLHITWNSVPTNW